MVKFTGFAETYMPNGHTKKSGGISKNSITSQIPMRKIAKGGRVLFYKGKCSDALIHT